MDYIYIDMYDDLIAEHAAGDLEQLGDDIRWLSILGEDERKDIVRKLTPELIDASFKIAEEKLGSTLLPRNDLDGVALDQTALMRDRVESIIVGVRWAVFAQYRWPELNIGYSFSASDAYRSLIARVEEFDRALGQRVSGEACRISCGWRAADDLWHWSDKL